MRASSLGAQHVAGESCTQNMKSDLPPFFLRIVFFHPDALPLFMLFFFFFLQHRALCTV